MTPLSILGLLFTAWVTVNLVRNIRSGVLWRDYAALRVLKGWRWLPALLGSWLVLVVVVAVGILLVAAWPQVMGWSWLMLLATKEEAPTAGRNLMVSGLQIPWFAWVFLLLMAINVPGLAMNEELMFRKGRKKPGVIAYQSVKFGLVHCLVGVPIGFGLALGIGGFWFALQYLRGGVRRSTAYHALHNWTLLSLAGLWLAGVLR